MALQTTKFDKNDLVPFLIANSFCHEFFLAVSLIISRLLLNALHQFLLISVLLLQICANNTSISGSHLPIPFHLIAIVLFRLLRPEYVTNLIVGMALCAREFIPQILYL
ncbi:hypothetical protein CEXT_645991 [Caerostris extrusa]|uniref:Uncharacterized protein n=1 Tax=Caerostris extrusa TaxID=172846 RepID=A0AAV4MIZ8_CAEEX|nr:hypothetical protein CEXT_645991 [Caerostris extrusa]